jgi:DNA ligase-1
MELFARLYTELDRATGTRRKLDALVRYFRAAEPADAAWAVHFLSGEKIKRAITGRELRELAAEQAGIPEWLVNESYDFVGDLAETIALLLPEIEAVEPIRLRDLVEQRTLPLPMLDSNARRAFIVDTWSHLTRAQRFVWHKLMLGAFRIGVAKRNLTKALAEVAHVDAAVMAHRMSGSWHATAERFESLISGTDESAARSRPYPFFLAHQIDDAPDDLGPIGDWWIEWKYDGIRAQLIHRGGELLLWSRGEEMIGGAFPELIALGGLLPDGVVLDGEVLAWEHERPLPFSALQRRLNRKNVQWSLFDDVPVIYMAFDLLERDDEDLRDRPLSDRRDALETLLRPLEDEDHLRVAPPVDVDSWDALANIRSESRERGVEGVMIKRRDSPYRVGRTRGDWWKWKVDPYTVDAVLLHAQRGHGRRAGLYTDFTFGVWEGDALVPFTKAYSGLTDDEFRAVNRFINANTIGRHGPVRTVRPELVFEIGFEGIQASDRHKAGIALRFPRMLRWRRDKKPGDADTLTSLRELLESVERRSQ